MKKITKAQQIKDILAPIPAENFIVDTYELHGKYCALGHIHMALSGDEYGDRMGFGARKLTEKFLKEKHNTEMEECIAAVNNRPDVNGYTEPVIKDRVMHLVEDMIAAGY